MITPRELDRVVGIKHYVIKERIDTQYVMSPQSFYVEEIIDFSRLGFNETNGEYIVFKAMKRNIDTFELLRRFSRRLNIPQGNIIYLGLKDKNSTSIQYVFVKKAIIREKVKLNEYFYEDKELKIKAIGYAVKKPRPDTLICNKFRVLIDEEKYIDAAKTIMKKIGELGLPSYYGYQRFGIKRPNTHYIGKLLLSNNYVDAYREFLYGLYLNESISSLKNRVRKHFDNKLFYEHILYTRRDPFGSWKILPYNLLRLFIEAYQSYLYNLYLSRLIDLKRWPFNEELCVPGINCINEEIAKILEIESLDPTVFENCLIYRLYGWKRRSLFKPQNIAINRLNNGFFIEFCLERGQYASIVLRELFKENYILLY
mgnify:CR=1 FL=1